MLTRFEEQYEAHTERLSRLMTRRHGRRSAVHAEIATCRQALAATARVLQHMADRDFGRCGHCAQDIPIDRLSSRPHVRYCPRCEEEAAVPA